MLFQVVPHNDIREGITYLPQCHLSVFPLIYRTLLRCRLSDLSRDLKKFCTMAFLKTKLDQFAMGGAVTGGLSCNS